MSMEIYARDELKYRVFVYFPSWKGDCDLGEDTSSW